MTEDLRELVKKGTTTVGIVCRDGVVLAADKRATIGYLISNKKIDKILQITDRMAITMAGTVSDAQLIIKLVKAELKLKEVRTYKVSTTKEAANLLGGILYGSLRRMSMFPGIAHFLLAGKDNLEKKGVF